MSLLPSKAKFVSMTLGSVLASSMVFYGFRQNWYGFGLAALLCMFFGALIGLLHALFLNEEE